MDSSIRRNFIYNAFYQILTLILPLITTPYISRVLGANLIGTYSYAYSIAYYFGLFILLGLNNYGNRTIASARNDHKELSKSFWSIYAMQLFFGIIVIIIYITYIFISNANNNLMVWIQLIYLLSVVLDINWFFFGIEEFKLTVTRNSLIKVLTVILIIMLVKTNDDIYIYALIMAICPLISQLYLWLFLKKYITFNKISVNDVRKHILPNLKLFIPIIAISLYAVMSKIFLGQISGFEEVGFYESANKVTVIPTMAITALGTVMLPRVSNMVSRGQHKESLKYLENSLIISVFLSVPMSLGLSAISNEFVPLFYGVGFEKCILLIPILVLSSIFLSWANVIRTQYLIPYKKDKIYIQSVFLGALINIIINLILIPQFKSLGAAIATLFTEATVCIYQTIKVRKELPIKMYVKKSIPYLLFGVIMYFIVVNITLGENVLLTLLIKVLIGSCIYLCGSFIYFKLNKNIM